MNLIIEKNDYVVYDRISATESRSVRFFKHDDLKSTCEYAKCINQDVSKVNSISSFGLVTIPI